MNNFMEVNNQNVKNSRKLKSNHQKIKIIVKEIIRRHFNYLQMGRKMEIKVISLVLLIKQRLVITNYLEKRKTKKVVQRMKIVKNR